MPVLYRADGSSAVFDTVAEVQAALRSGEWTTDASGKVAYTQPGGGNVELTPEQQALRPRSGDYTGGETAPNAEPNLGLALREAYSGIGDQIKGFGEGAGSILSFGLSDPLLRAAGADTANRSKYTTGRTAGEIAGIAATVLTPLGAEGALSKLPTTALSKWAAAGATPLARVARAAGEGAAYGLGQEVSKVALSDPGFSGEHVLGDMAMGTFLGAALGGAGGALIEGAGAGRTAYTQHKASQGVIDFSTGPGRAVIESQANLHRTVEDMVAYTAKSDAADIAARVVAHAEAGASARAGDVAIAETAALGSFRGDVAPVQDALRDVQRAVDDPAMYLPDDVTALWNAHNAAAREVGVARLSRAELKGVISAADAGDMGPLANLAKQSDSLLKSASLHDAAAERKLATYVKSGSEAHAVDYLKHLHAGASANGATDVTSAVQAALARGESHAAKAAELKAVRSPAASVDSTDARMALNHVLSRPPGTNEFMRLTRMEPKAQLAAAERLGGYYEAALEATKHNVVASANIKDALAQLGDSMGAIVSPEMTAQLTPDVISAVLNVPVASLPSGPVTDEMLKFVAVQRLTAGVMSTKGPAKGLVNRIAHAIGRRAASTAGAVGVRNLGITKMLPDVLQAGLGGGAYAAGGHVFGFLAGGSGLKGVVNSTAAADARIGAAVKRIAGGTPAKRRVMPALDAIFNKLLPEPEHKGKKPAEKFKVIQERLTQFGTSPQSFSAKFYEMLRPVQQVSEQLADTMETTLGTQLQYAAANLPRDPGTMMMLGKSMWVPTDRQLYEYGLRMMGTMYPLDTVDMIADGLVPPQAVEALRETNPATFARLQQHIIDNVDDIRANSTYDQRIALGLAFTLPLDPTTDPRYVAFMQSMHAQKTMQQAAGNASEDKSPEESYSDAQKLLA